MNKKLIIIFVIAFVIRLISLDQSLWLDEATTARVVQQYNFSEILTKFSPHDFHPPLYYWFMKVWTSFFGYSEISLRMPSLIFSLLTGYIIFKIATLLHGYIVGIWATVFFLFNPLIIYYSQEARMYMTATFTLTASLYFLVLITQKSKVKSQKYKLKVKIYLILFNIFLILSFLIFYGSVFFIFSILIYLLFKKQFKYLTFTSLFLILALLIISPLLNQQFTNAKLTLSSVTNWSLVLGKANIKNLLLIPIKFSFGRISFEPKILYYTISGIWTFVVWFFVIMGASKNKLMFYLIIGPLIIGLLISFWTPLLQYFRFLYLIPIMSILLSLGITNLASKHQVGVLVSTVFVILSLIYLLIPNFHREDWKSLAKDLPENSTVYMIKTSSDPLVYYRDDCKVINMVDKSTLVTQKKIIVIPYTAEIHGVDYQKNLFKYGYNLVERKSFRQVFYEIWQH